MGLIGLLRGESGVEVSTTHVLSMLAPGLGPDIGS